MPSDRKTALSDILEGLARIKTDMERSIGKITITSASREGQDVKINCQIPGAQILNIENGHIKKNSNWYNVAKEKGLLYLFENRLTNSSDEKIDLTWYLDEKGKDTFVEHNHFNRNTPNK